MTAHGLSSSLAPKSMHVLSYNAGKVADRKSEAKITPSVQEKTGREYKEAKKIYYKESTQNKME